jgi:hypothetical protein
MPPPSRPKLVARLVRLRFGHGYRVPPRRAAYTRHVSTAKQNRRQNREAGHVRDQAWWPWPPDYEWREERSGAVVRQDFGRNADCRSQRVRIGLKEAHDERIDLIHLAASRRMIRAASNFPYYSFNNH